MAKIFVPYALRKLTQGQTVVEIPGDTLGVLIDAFDEKFPGVKEKLVENGRIKPGLAAVCGHAPTRQGLMQPLEADTEVHFVPAISGG